MENIYYSNFKNNEFSYWLASSKDELISIGINESKDDFLDYIKKGLYNYRLIEDNRGNKEANLQLVQYFNSKRRVFDLPLKFIGTDFEKRVWAELIKIPYGSVVSYKDIAKAIGSDKAYRAVGMANRKNRLPIVVPCHRVIGADRKLVGYAGGLEIKKKLLAIEGLKCINDVVVLK